MFTTQDFIGCIKDNLKAKGFKRKRIKELTDDFKSRADAHHANGMNVTDASVKAMSDVFENLSMVTAERVKRTAKMISVQAENIARIADGANAPTSIFVMDGKMGTQGVAIGRSGVAMIENDPRFVGGNYSGTREVIRNQLLSLFDTSLQDLGKGAFGRQKGKAHLDNIVREVRGVDTGDRSAKAFAKAWMKVQDLSVDLFNAAGGSMRRLEAYVPQVHNAVKMINAGRKNWVEFHLRAVDWNRTRHPDGRLIPEAERVGVLEAVFKTKSTNGANKIDPKAFRGQGKAIGNALENHRFIHYKDAEGWLNAHKLYGDGNVFEVFTRHVDTMAHRIALIDTFGPNPEMTALNIKSLIRKEAEKYGPKALIEAEAILKNKFDPMLTMVTRENPMDPHSTFGNLVVGTSNITTSAVLGAASFLAVPGDFMQTAWTRSLNNMGLFDGMDFYFKTLATDIKFQQKIAIQSGFVFDEVVMSTYSMARFTGPLAAGPAVSRHISEATMRASLMSGHTKSARWAVQAEFMGLLDRMKTTKYEDLPFIHVMRRHGVDASDWDAFRKGVRSWQPRQDVNFLRPIDVLETDIPNKQRLYQKLQSMIFEESRTMVPEATIEATAQLRSTLRPDTLPGAILHSFSMFKNFPVSFNMIYGRLGMTIDSKIGRLGAYASLAAGMTVVGALGTQMREVSKGRDPLPMDTVGFYGKSFLAGGAASILGDFLFTGINEYGRGPAQVVGGPLVGLLGDTSQLLLGDVFQFVDAMGSLDSEGFKSTTGARAVEFARRYTPVLSSLWWARAALGRNVFDRLQDVADPKAYRKRRAKARRQRNTFGNESWWAPGDALPGRAPRFGD